MRNLIIKGTGSSPELHFNVLTGKYKIEGESRPENVSDLYDPILDWVVDLESHILESMKADSPSTKQTHTFIFDYGYFNSASGLYIYKIISKIDALQNAIESYQFMNDCSSQVEIEIEWLHEADDEIMIEAAAEMQVATEIDILTKIK